VTAIFRTLVEVSVRGLLGRRRTILLLLLAGIPVLVALLARLAGGRLDLEPVFSNLVARFVLPLTALVFGTAALGSELEDGTALYVIAKPVPRWLVIAAKVLVAGALAGALTVGSTLLTGFLIAGFGTTGLATTFSFAVATGLAAFVYVAIFVALSVMTSRALIIGLIYTFVWEGILSGVLEGTKLFSVREATVGLAASLAPATAEIQGGLDLLPAIGLLAIVFGGALVLGTRALETWEAKATE
jgi:ABC-2 type transport system permease protein